MSAPSCAMGMIAPRHATFVQRAQYAEGLAVPDPPKLERAEFRPGGGRGRPPIGMEKQVFKDVEEVKKFLRTPQWKKYKRIKLFFVDCQWMEARVEECYGKRLLVTEHPTVGIVIVCSA